MSTKHTPGPWIPSYTKIGSVTAENGAVIAKCMRLTSLSGLEANARLIAAAPELLEALQALETLFAPRACDSTAATWIDKARAAIAKATGQEVA